MPNEQDEHLKTDLGRGDRQNGSDKRPEWMEEENDVNTH